MLCEFICGRGGAVGWGVGWREIISAVGVRRSFGCILGNVPKRSLSVNLKRLRKEVD